MTGTDRDPGQLLELLRSMWRIRLFEERVRDLRLAGDIVGSVHLCIGQEAIPAGALAALDPARDAVFATYRGHGYALACGAEPAALFGELLGRATGPNGGRGGSAYLSDPDHGFYGENSIVGAGVPIATGAALAARFDGSGRVAVSVCGDGALNQGAVHEAYNFAAYLRLPVIFLVENNGYAELTPIRDTVGNDRLYERAAGYGFPGRRIDGNDPCEVRDAVAAARQVAADGGGPTLLEAITERLVGHYIGDPEHYRPAGEVARATEQEPIVRLTARLRATGVSTASLAEIHRCAAEEIDTAAGSALAAPLADPATAKEHLYA